MNDVRVTESHIYLNDEPLTQMQAIQLGTRLINAATDKQAHQEKEIAESLLSLVGALNEDCDWDWCRVMKLVYDNTLDTERKVSAKPIVEFGQCLEDGVI